MEQCFRSIIATDEPIVRQTLNDNAGKPCMQILRHGGQLCNVETAGSAGRDAEVAARELAAERTNRRRSLGFVSNALWKRRRFRAPNIVYDRARESRGRIVVFSISGKRLARHLDHPGGGRWISAGTGSSWATAHPPPMPVGFNTSGAASGRLRLLAAPPKAWRKNPTRTLTLCVRPKRGRSSDFFLNDGRCCRVRLNTNNLGDGASYKRISGFGART